MLVAFDRVKPLGRVHLDPEAVAVVEEVEANGVKAAILRLESGGSYTVLDPERDAAARLVAARLEQVFTTEVDDELGGQGGTDGAA